MAMEPKKRTKNRFQRVFLTLWCKKTTEICAAEVFKIFQFPDLSWSSDKFYDNSQFLGTRTLSAAELAQSWRRACPELAPTWPWAGSEPALSLCWPRNDLLLTWQRPRADLTLTLCWPRVKLVPSLWWAHSELTMSLCLPRLKVTLCHAISSSC